jgi:hypothetical protein
MMNGNIPISKNARVSPWKTTTSPHANTRVRRTDSSGTSAASYRKPPHDSASATHGDASSGPISGSDERGGSHTPSGWPNTSQSGPSLAMAAKT